MHVAESLAAQRPSTVSRPERLVCRVAGLLVLLLAGCAHKQTFRPVSPKSARTAWASGEVLRVEAMPRLDRTGSLHVDFELRDAPGAKAVEVRLTRTRSRPCQQGVQGHIEGSFRELDSERTWVTFPLEPLWGQVLVHPSSLDVRVEDARGVARCLRLPFARAAPPNVDWEAGRAIYSRASMLFPYVFASRQAVARGMGIGLDAGFGRWLSSAGRGWLELASNMTRRYSELATDKPATGDLLELWVAGDYVLVHSGNVSLRAQAGYGVVLGRRKLLAGERLERNVRLHGVRLGPTLSIALDHLLRPGFVRGERTLTFDIELPTRILFPISGSAGRLVIPALVFSAKTGF